MSEKLQQVWTDLNWGLTELVVLLVAVAAIAGAAGYAYEIDRHHEEQHRTQSRQMLEMLAIQDDLLEMIERDDELLDFLLNGTWDRSCGYRKEPWHQLADGTIRQQLIQECD